MKKKDNDIIILMREEWNAKMAALEEEVDLMFNAKIDNDKKSVISPGLKLKSKDEQVLYKVIAVSIRGVDLRPPDGLEDGSKDFFVDKNTLEKNYELD
jgi:hypothetical protein